MTLDWQPCPSSLIHKLKSTWVPLFFFPCHLEIAFCWFRQCATLDQEAISQLDSKLKEDRRAAASAASSSPAAAALMYHGAYFLLLAGRPERAVEYADRLLRASPKSALGLSIRGWIELHLPIDTVSTAFKTQAWNETGLSSSSGEAT